jgi:hypothetical protein
LKCDEPRRGDTIRSAEGPSFVGERRGKAWAPGDQETIGQIEKLHLAQSINVKICLKSLRHIR